MNMYLKMGSFQFDVFKRLGLVVRTVHDIGGRQAFAHIMAGCHYVWVSGVNLSDP